MRILVVDDEKIKRITLADDLAAQGHEVVAAADGEEALRAAWRRAVRRRGDRSEDAQARRHRTAEADQARPAGRHGSHHDDRLRQHSRGGRGGQARGVRLPHQALPQRGHLSAAWRGSNAQRQAVAETARRAGEPARRPTSSRTIVGQSAAMDRVKRMVEICAKTDANVLLVRRDGRGQGPAGHVIHRNSHRRGFPFVKVGCTLFPPQLIESELYGHEKGSFTGAEQQRKGRFDLAEGGTLYLDDVDDIPVEQQSKLLRAIEEKVFERVGGGAPIKADVRIIASTKRNLLEKIAEGTFRAGPLLPARRAADQHPAAARAAGRRAAVGRASARSGSPATGPAASTPRRWRCSRGTTGRATSASCTTRLERAYLDRRRATSRPRCWPPRSAGPTPTSDCPSAVSRPPSTMPKSSCCKRRCATPAATRPAAAAALGMKPSTFRDKLAKHGLG